jgi:cell division protein FtsN
MSSPRTEHHTRPDQAEEKPPRSTLSVTQVVAGALAAVSAAVAASFFGVAGTVIGAALVSVVSTVGSALYGASLDRTGERLRRTRHARPTRATPDGDTRTRELPAALDPRRAPAPRRRPRWSRVAAYAVAVFAAAMVVVTGVELVGQKPVAALVGGTDTPSSSSTTIGELSTASSSRDTAPSTPPEDDPADGGSSEAPESTAPTGTTEPEDAGGSSTPTRQSEEPAPTSGSEDEDGSGEDGSGEPGDTSPAEPSQEAPGTGSGTGTGDTGPEPQAGADAGAGASAGPAS